ncbi:hypothetical protein F2Q70_00038430 [Brassica cretica]|uniref:Uncharacterized protein n=1 Tax=Brassica cretica TaxID=69181 RepID=A0A8S9K2Q2_BRACR|nr:hypothetical protein F2Q70_00038430 [Brassica cretica]KAF3492791.1 hypothetical protein DY000_02052662 [Brassica cretica]
MSRGSPWILRSRLGPRGSYQTTRSFIWDPEVFYLGPGTETGARGRWLFLRSGDRIETLVYLDPKVAWEPEGTVLHLPRQDYYRYLFGFSILPLGSWPLSSSYAVFYFCRKSLTCLDGAGVGVMTQVPSLRCFPLLEKQDLDCVGVENGYDKVNVQISAKISMSIFYESDSS